MQSAVQGTANRVNSMHAFHGILGLFGSRQLHCDVDAAYDEHASLRFHLTSHFRDELPVAGINVTRFQKCRAFTPQSRRSRVMLSDGPVNAEDHFSRFAG
jgi:hypothetical protein